MKHARLARPVSDSSKLGVMTDERVRERAAFVRAQRRRGLARGLVDDEHRLRFESHDERRVGLGCRGRVGC